LLGETPNDITMIGLEPERIELGIGLSPAVQASVNDAAGVVRQTINRLLGKGSLV